MTGPLLIEYALIDLGRATRSGRPRPGKGSHQGARSIAAPSAAGPVCTPITGLTRTTVTGTAGSASRTRCASASASSGVVPCRMPMRRGFGVRVVSSNSRSTALWARAWPLDALDLPVRQLQHGLHTQQRAQERPCPADAPTLLQIFERVDDEQHAR